MGLDDMQVYTSFSWFKGHEAKKKKKKKKGGQWTQHAVGLLHSFMNRTLLISD